MPKLLEIKEHIQKFYQKYAFALNPLFRFIISSLVFYAANKVVGYNPTLNHRYVEVILGAITVVFPAQVLMFFASVFIVLHVLYVSKYLALVMAVVFAILYFMYVRFLPKDGYVIMAMPVLFAFHIPYALPILMGLLSTPLVIVPIGFGVVIYYLIETVISVISTSTDDAINLYHLVLQQMFSDKQLYVALIVFSIVTIVVYLIRNRQTDFSFEISILAGAFLNTILFLIINYILDININMIQFMISIVVSAILVWIVQFFRLSLNYSGVENLQFEDEEYYYYVRAVPKMNIVAADKNIKRFNSHSLSERVSYLEEEGVHKIHEAISGKKSDDEAEENSDKFDHDFDFTVSLDKDDLEDMKKD